MQRRANASDTKRRQRCSGRNFSPKPGAPVRLSTPQVAVRRELTTVISIAFPRYVRDTVSMTRLAHQQEIPILVITDSQTSPLAKLGKVVIYANARRSFSPTSDAAVLAVLEALVAAVANRKPGAAAAAQRLTDVGFYWFAYPEDEEKALTSRPPKSPRKKDPP